MCKQCLHSRFATSSLLFQVTLTVVCVFAFRSPTPLLHKRTFYLNIFSPFLSLADSLFPSPCLLAELLRTESTPHLNPTNFQTIEYSQPTKSGCTNADFPKCPPQPSKLSLHLHCRVGCPPGKSPSCLCLSCFDTRHVKVFWGAIARSSWILSVQILGSAAADLDRAQGGHAPVRLEFLERGSVMPKGMPL